MSPRNCCCWLFRADLLQQRHPAGELVEKEGAPLLLDTGAGGLAAPLPVALVFVEEGQALRFV